MIKIIKIITALNNPGINKKLSEQKNIKIIGKDVQYKEAIIDLLENNKNIDYIFIYEKILGEIKLDYLFKKIKEINNKIKIIYFLEKPNKNKEKILYKNNIKNIYYLNDLNLNNILKILNINDFEKINYENKNELLELNRLLKNKKNNIKYKNKIINLFNLFNYFKLLFIKIKKILFKNKIIKNNKLNIFKKNNNKFEKLLNYKINNKNNKLIIKIEIDLEK